MSQDGVPFLRHNYQLPDGRWCHDVAWNELKELKIEGEPLPLLEDVLVWARDELGELCAGGSIEEGTPACSQ